MTLPTHSFVSVICVCVVALIPGCRQPQHPLVGAAVSQPGTQSVSGRHCTTGLWCSARRCMALRGFQAHGQPCAYACNGQLPGVLWHISNACCGQVKHCRLPPNLGNEFRAPIESQAPQSKEQGTCRSAVCFQPQGFKQPSGPPLPPLNLAAWVMAVPVSWYSLVAACASLLSSLSAPQYL
jgi:hypothetical protein